MTISKLSFIFNSLRCENISGDYRILYRAKEKAITVLRMIDSKDLSIESSKGQSYRSLRPLNKPLGDSFLNYS